MNTSDTRQSKKTIRDANMRLLDVLPRNCMAKGNSVRDRRLELDWTQEELSRKAGVSQRGVSHAENQIGEQTKETLFAIANALGVPMAYVAHISIEYSGIDDKIDKAIIEVLRVINADHHQTGVLVNGAREFIDECIGIEELRTYNSLSEYEQDRLWNLTHARGWTIVDKNGVTQIAGIGQATISSSFRRLLATMSELYTAPAMLLMRHRIFEQSPAPWAEPGIAAFDAESFASELRKRIQVLQSLPTNCPSSDFRDCWCAFNLLYLTDDTYGTNLVSYLHEGTKLAYEFLQTAEDGGELFIPVYRELATVTCQEALNLLEKTIENPNSTDFIPEWKIKFDMTASSLFGYIINPLIYIALNEEAKQQALASFTQWSEDPIFTDEFRRLQARVYFKIFPNLVS